MGGGGGGKSSYGIDVIHKGSDFLKHIYVIHYRRAVGCEPYAVFWRGGTEVPTTTATI